MDLQILELQGFAIGNKLGELASGVRCLNFCHDFAVGMAILNEEVDDCAEGDGRCVASCEPNRGLTMFFLEKACGSPHRLLAKWFTMLSSLISLPFAISLLIQARKSPRLETLLD